MSLDDDLTTRWCDHCHKVLTTPEELADKMWDCCDDCLPDKSVDQQ